MPFPSYVPTVEVSVGGALVLESGDQLELQVSFKANRGLTWQASGMQFPNVGAAAERSSAGGEVTWTLPATNVPGWLDLRSRSPIDVDGGERHTHSYTADIQLVRGGKTITPPQKIGPFYLPEGSGPVDLDTLVPAEGERGQLISIPDQWSALVAEAQQAAQDAAAALSEAEGFIDERVAPVAALVEQVAEQAPTLDDLTISVPVPAATVETLVPLGVALYPQRLRQIAFLWPTSIAASNTNYWIVDLIRRQAGSVDIVATKTTKVTLGQAITAFAPWTFDTSVLSNAGMVAGASLYARLRPVGSPPALPAGIVSFRCPPADVTLPESLFTDDFNRANETLLTVASDGQSWDLVNAMGVTSNQARATASAGYAIKDVDRADYQVTATLVSFPTSSSAGLFLAWQDADNYVTTTGSQVTSRIGGATGPVIDSAFDDGLTFAAGDRIRAIVRAGKLFLYIDKGNAGEFALATPGGTIPPELVGNTAAGMRSGGNAAIWDNFVIESVEE